MSNTNEIIHESEELNIESVSFGSVRKNKRGGKTIQVLYNGNNFVGQAPMMMSYGISEMVDEDSGKVSYSVTLQFTDGDINTPQGKLLKFLKDLQDKIIDTAVKNSKAWFGTQQIKQVVEALFNPFLKYPKDKETGELDYSRLPTLKLKVPFWENKFNIELYNMNEEPIYTPDMEGLEQTPVDMVSMKSSLISVFQSAGIYFIGGKFGVSFRLLQAQVRPPVRIKGFCIKKTTANQEFAKKIEEMEASGDEEDHDQEEEQEASATIVEDSDEEEEEPEPEEKPKKRGGRKKKT